MKRFLKKAVSVMLGLMMTVPGVCAAASGPYSYDKVEVWCRKDIILLSEKKYDNAYTDVDIDAVFTHEDGTKINLYGFWNGGDEWRVRFAPTKTGKWDYVITCSDKENAALNTSGSLVAVKNTGNTELDKHGFIKISDNGRYFVYDDGEPFYWLGDTNWQAPNYVSITKCNYPGCSCGNQFFHEVNDRVEKGFTVYQTYFDSAESDGGGQLSVTEEPSMWTEKYGKINPDTFSEKYDVMFDYLAYKGMVIALGFGVHTSTVNAMGSKELDRLSRYLTARYAAYPVVWITAQEITGQKQFEAWVSSARIVDTGDGYDHPQSAHQYPLSVNDKYVQALNKEDWHDFFALQNGHGPAIPKKSTYKGYYNSDKTKPFVETEANYEDIHCGGFNGYSASRIAAWKANLCGSCGFTYGVTGIWANCWSTAGSTGWLGSYSTEPWYMGLDKPGSYEMKYMARFFKYVDFSVLVPRFDSNRYSDFKTETKVLASSDDNKIYVAYLYNSDDSAGKLFNLNKEDTYTAKWYDPLTGKFILISDSIKASEYEIPQKPTADDWVLLLSSKELDGNIEYEPLPQKKALSKTNVLFGTKATASTSSAVTSDPSKAIDNKEDTWWCASSGDFPQYITFSSKTEMQFNAFDLKLYPGTSAATYRVEISDDGKNFVTVFSAEDEVTEKLSTASLLSNTLDKTYTCKYIRFYFEKVVGNWAAVVEASAYVKDGTESSGKEFEGELQSPGIFCTGGYKYNAFDESKDTAKNVTDGDLSTVWTPFAPEATQTFIFDLYEIKEVYGMNIIFGKNSVTFGCRIEGSADGQSWYILANSMNTGAEYYMKGDNPVTSADLCGKYRYIKLILGGAPDNKSKKTIAETEIYAQGETEKQTAKTDIKQLLKTYKEYKNVNNKDGEYYGPRYRDFMLSMGDAARLLSGVNAADTEVKAAADRIKECASALKTDPDEEKNTETEEITENETGSATPSSDHETSKDGEESKKAFPVIPVVIGAVAAAAAVITAVTVIKKRKKK